MLSDRLRVKFEPNEAGCWIWRGAQNGRGYGHVRSAGPGGPGSGPVRPAHRVVFEALVGAILDGMEPDHTCRVKLCVNPDHIEIVTRAENVRRSWMHRDEVGRRVAGGLSG